VVSLLQPDALSNRQKPSVFSHDSRECRRRAQQCRELAKSCLTGEAASVLKEIATDLDHQADHLETKGRNPVGSGRY
jgi:hypothetical protein